MSGRLRDVIVAAAGERSLAVGWSGVTMVAVAQQVGVSRQTVYNEVGTKASLSRLVVADATDELLAVFDVALGSHPGDVVAGVRRAVHDLAAAMSLRPMVGVVVAGIHGVDAAALPVPAAELSEVLERATDLFARHLDRAIDHPADESVTDVDRAVIATAVVRLVLSTAAAPANRTGSNGSSGDEIAWVTARLLR